MADLTRGPRTVRRRRFGVVLGPAAVNTAIGVLVFAALGTGLASWALPDTANGWLTTMHSIAGLLIVLLIPSKLFGPVRTGMRRGSRGRWLSALFGVVVLATLVFGFLHAAGISHGIGTWSTLWTHQLLGFVSAALIIMHITSRPVRPTRRDLDRRSFLRLTALGAGAVILRVSHEPIRQLTGGPPRRATGSYEVGSYQPGRMPTVFWINDRSPEDTASHNWRLTIQGRPVPIAELWERSSTVDAILDCTGGWWSAQRWDAVPLADLVTDPSGRSVRVTSATGYQRWYGLGELDSVHLAVGYNGRQLRPGHGAPVRLVVPGRRGPEWVKWVVEVADSNRPASLTSPLPLS